MDSLLRWGGTALMVVLLWRLLTWRAWKPYPFFFWFYAGLFGRWLLLIVLTMSIPRDSYAYAVWYWYTSLFLQFLKFFVAWEVYRQMLPRGSTANRAAGALLAGTMIVLAALQGLAGVREAPFFVAMEINLAFAVAAWMVGALAIVSYYRYPPSLNVWGMALGIGLFGALSVVNDSMLGISAGAYPVFRLVRPIGFICTVVLWIWTLWSYWPTAPRPPAPGSTPGDADFAGRARERLRRALGLQKHIS